MIVNMFIEKNFNDIYWYLLIILFGLGLIALLVTGKRVWLSLTALSLFGFLTSLAYQVGNLCMYLYSMPLYEARRLASYDRYFNSMKIYIGLLVLAWFISLYRSNKLYVGLSLTILVAICILDNARLGQALVPADRLAHDVDMLVVGSCWIGQVVVTYLMLNYFLIPIHVYIMGQPISRHQGLSQSGII